MIYESLLCQITIKKSKNRLTYGILIYYLLLPQFRLKISNLASFGSVWLHFIMRLAFFGPGHLVTLIHSNSKIFSLRHYKQTVESIE
jgi:hypothetical protein